MGIAAFPFAHETCPAAVRRFELALAASILLHAVLGTALMFEIAAPEQRARGLPPITVHIQQQVSPAMDPVALAVEALPVAELDRPRAAVADPAASPQSSRETVASLALPQAPDPTYYAARDLDTFPRPAAPLDLDRFAAELATRLRFSLAIDEFGSVRDIAVIEGDPGERVREEVRAMLTATRFIPGRRDGRAVKSRVQLEVVVGQLRDAR